MSLSVVKGENGSGEPLAHSGRKVFDGSGRETAEVGYSTRLNSTSCNPLYVSGLVRTTYYAEETRPLHNSCSDQWTPYSIW